MVALKKATGAKVHMDLADAKGDQMYPLTPDLIDAPWPAGNSEYQVDELTFRIWHTPGHTPGGVVIACGGYDHTTMGEDMELCVKLHVFCRENARPYRIRYAADAVCWTQVPERFGDLCKQRRRWHIGFSEHDEAPPHSR